MSEHATFSCPNCGAVFASEGQLQEHVATTHPPPQPTPTPEPPMPPAPPHAR